MTARQLTAAERQAAIRLWNEGKGATIYEIARTIGARKEAVRAALPACGALDPATARRTCAAPMGHRGRHRDAGATWDDCDEPRPLRPPRAAESARPADSPIPLDGPFPEVHRRLIAWLKRAYFSRLVPQHRTISALARASGLQRIHVRAYLREAGIDPPAGVDGKARPTTSPRPPEPS